MPTALLLHGWGTSPERLEPLRRALLAAGVEARQHTYDPTGSVRTLGASLAADIGSSPAHLVGHSLGGLVAASAVLDHRAPACSVTTINTPWRGTWAAWTAERGDQLGLQLRWGASELDRLRGLLAADLALPSGPHWRVLSALGDLAVPVTGALRVPRGPRLTTGVVPVVGHSVSLQHPAMVEAVVDGLPQHVPA